MISLRRYASILALALLPTAARTAAADGNRIVFVSDRDGNDEIYVMRADGDGQRRLTHDEFTDSEPSWSPDGRRIAFHSNRDGDYEVFVIDADGTGLRQLTDNAYNDGGPTWSPDGSRIVFHSDRHPRAMALDGESEIFMMRPDGSDVAQLTGSHTTKFLPRWSPDGRSIVYYFQLNYKPRTLSTLIGANVSEVYVQSLDGSSLRNLTRQGSLDAEATWSPDGRRIAYTTKTSVDDESMDIYICDADGANRERITSAAGMDGWPHWSPDGRRLVFHSMRDGDIDIYTADLATGQIRQLTRTRWGDKFPDWSRGPRADGGFSASLDTVEILRQTDRPIAAVQRRVPGPTVSVATRAGHTGIVRTFGEADGLPAGLTIVRVLQDRRGHMWFGSRHHGVVHYDGRSFTRTPLAGPWSSDWVASLAHGRDGSMWFGTSTGVVRLRDGTLSYLAESGGLPTGFTYALHEDPDGTLWIGMDSGLYALRGSGPAVCIEALDDVAVYALLQSGNDLLVSTNAGVLRWDGRKAQPFHVPHARGQLDNLFRQDDRDGPGAMFANSDGRLWFTHGGYVLGGGIVRLDGDDFEVFGPEQGLPALAFGGIGEDSRGNMWFRKDGGGLVRYDGRSFETFEFPDYHASEETLALAIDAEDNLWTGSREGILCYVQGQVDPVPDAGLDSADVRALLEDRDGHLWAGTRGGGVKRRDGSGWQAFTVADGLAHDTVGEILQDVRGHLWFATGNVEAVEAGVTRFDGERFETFTTDDGLAHDEVWCLFEDSRGHVWIGTRRGVTRYDGRDFTSFTTADGLAAFDVWRVAEDRRGHLWFATWGGGVSRFDGDRFETFTTAHGLPSNDVSDVLEASDGSLWFATWGGGVARFDGTTFTTFTTDDGLANDEIGRIFQDRRGHLWFGSGGNEVHLAAPSRGISRFDGERFRTFSRDDGLPAHEVWTFREDAHGHLLLPTMGSGLAMYDGEIFQTVRRADGLADDLVWDVAVAGSGDVWLATAHGLTRYRPRDSPPPIEIRQVSTDRQHGPALKVAFDTRQDYLGIDYHAISYKTRPEGMFFLRRLRGLHDDWRLTRERRAEYGDLPRGEYRFEIVAVDRDLNRSSSPATVAVEVHAPYDIVIPGTAALLLLAVAVFATTRTVRSRSAMLRSQQELLSMTEERNYALEQSNLRLAETDRLKSDFVANVSHELRTPLTVIRGLVDNMVEGIAGSLDPDQAHYVNRLKVHADRLSVLIEDLLDLSQIEAGQLTIQKLRTSLAALSADVVDQLQPLAAREGITLSMRSSDAPGEALVDPNRIYQVLANLVNNAVKFTPSGGQVVVATEEIGGEVWVSVTDSGPGIPARERDRIFDKFHQLGKESGSSTRGTGIGLSIARRLVEMHGGRIWVEPGTTVGSRFVFSVPVTGSADGPAG